MKKDDRWSRGITWPTLMYFAIVHVGALMAFFYFSWTGLMVAVGLYIVTGCLGISVGFHRYLTHQAFRTGRWTARFMALVGELAGEGPVIQWVAVHRKHHAHSDREEDPHSPSHGPWWAHMLWFLPWTPSEEVRKLHRRWAPDLVEDRWMRFLSAGYLAWHILLAGFLLLAGWLIWDARSGLSLLLWGSALRTAALLHATWAVNSASHLWGYRNYETTDNSRNNWWVALVTFGEGWHNNHHAFPKSALFGHHRWWEMDPGYWIIWLMKALGLASDVHDDIMRYKLAARVRS